MDEVVTKLVHGDGPSRITMDTNNQIVSCGKDSTSVVFHKGGLEEDTYQFDIEGISSISDIVCYKRDSRYMVAIATNDHNVLSYSYCSGNTNDDLFAESEFDAMLLRFTAAINTLDVSSDFTKLAAGSSDFYIKMVDLIDTTKVNTLEGHEAPVLSVKFDPLNEYLASSSCDGTLKIWSIGDRVTLHSIGIFPKTNDVMFVSTLCRLSWQPDGQTLVVPVGNGVNVIKRESWNCIKTVNAAAATDDKSDHVTCWSPCGKYFAIGSSDGSIFVWAWPQCTLALKYSCDVGVISSLFWDRSGESSGHPLLFSSSSGHIGSLPRQWVYPISKEDPPPYDDPLIDDSLLLEGIPPDSIFEDFDDDDDITNAVTNTTNSSSANATSTAATSGTTTGRTSTATIGTRTTAAAGTSSTVAKRSKRDDLSSIDDVAPPTKRYHRITEDCFNEDESAAASEPGSPRVSSTNEMKEAIPVPAVAPQYYHEIFQPSATPSHLSNRFMVYNMVGVVRRHDDGGSSMVEVEFHDSSVHHPFSVPNHYGWSMASLSSKGLVLAVESSEDELSQLQCTVFASWDHSKDWSMQLPKGESIEVITLGDGWVAVATSKNYLRLFSFGGSQREIISYSGQIVTLAGRGEQLIVVYQETPSSSLTIWILNVVQRSQVSSPHFLPLTNEAKLEWIGFSEGGLPMSYDTKGIVRVLSCQYGSSWLPISDTTQSLGQKGDHYFVLGMTHNPNELRVILCKGMEYPPVQPRPVMSTLSLSVPFCEPQTEKSNIESQYLEKIFVHPLDVLPSPVDLLKPQMQLMALACRSNYEFRAFEVVCSMTAERGLDLSLQYASQSGHFRLARQISNLRERRLMEEEEEEEEQERYYVDQENGQDRNHSNETVTTHTSTSMNSVSRVRRTLLPVNGKGDKENHESTDERRQEDEEVMSDKDETKELYSDSEDYHHDDNESNINETPTSTSGYNGALFSSPLTGKKSSNPFKMATPLSKQLQVDRRSSFLDKICREAEEEKEKEKQKKNKKKTAASSSTTKIKTKKKSDGKVTSNKLSKFSFGKN